MATGQRVLLLLPVPLLRQERALLPSRWVLLAPGWALLVAWVLPLMLTLRQLTMRLARTRVRDPTRSRQLTLVPAPTLFPQELMRHLLLLSRWIRHRPTPGRLLVLQQPESPG